MNLAIIGATGNVGRKTIEILEKSNLSFDNLYLVASKKSAGKKIVFKGKELKVEELNNYNFSNAKITFFAAGKEISKVWARKAAKQLKFFYDGKRCTFSGSGGELGCFRLS